MTIHANRKAADDLTGKVLICKNRHYDHNSRVGNNTKEWCAGDLLLVLAHEKGHKAASWSRPTEVLRFFVDGAGGQITIDSQFDINWGIIEPEDIFKGKGFVFTGALQNTRDYYKKIVEMFGGTFQPSISGKTAYLVMADKNSMTTKAQKARALGVVLIDEREFLNLIRTGG